MGLQALFVRVYYGENNINNYKDEKNRVHVVEYLYESIDSIIVAISLFISIYESRKEISEQSKTFHGWLVKLHNRALT